MSAVKEILSEKTLVALSLIISLVGGIAFCAKAYGELENLRSEQQEYKQFMQNVDERLSRIEGRLGVSRHE